VNDLNRDYLRLSIYIYELLHVEICEVWIKAYKKVPGIVKLIINEYINRKDLSEFIRQTVLEILEELNKVCSDSYLVQAVIVPNFCPLATDVACPRTTGV
ncbi:MAG: hypothetical protein IJP51_07230, partial [Acidaminococcaceae bacterium]|nr:hypothetical protein [Acidaminococcaceae bacterium]